MTTPKVKDKWDFLLLWLTYMGYVALTCVVVGIFGVALYACVYILISALDIWLLWIILALAVVSLVPTLFVWRGWP